MISVTVKSKFEKTSKYLLSLSNPVNRMIFNKYGKIGLEALKNATPVDSGKTADSWSYTVEQLSNNRVRIVWSNSSTTDTGIPIVVLLQYGHGTRNGGYVRGVDFINPALQPVFESIRKSIWEEVKAKK